MLGGKQLAASPEDGHMHSGKTQGFSLMELVVAIAILMIATAITFVSLGPALKDSKVSNAYNSTLMTMRRAHDEAATSKRVYVVSFDNTVVPNSVTVSQNATMGAGGILLLKTQLPEDITYRTENGIPTSQGGACPTPDGFGTGSNAIDFNGNGGNGGTTIYFYPDGSARDQALNGALNNGVVYLARAGELYSSRAITLWGATGRLRGWRLYPPGDKSGTNCWRPQ